MKIDYLVTQQFTTRLNMSINRPKFPETEYNELIIKQAKERDKLLTKYLISVGVLDSNGNSIPVSKEKEDNKKEEDKRNYLKEWQELESMSCTEIEIYKDLLKHHLECAEVILNRKRLTDD